MKNRTRYRDPERTNIGGRRGNSGASIILLGGVIALAILPMIGLFAFETNRYQFLQQTLTKACDAAALAGGAKLIAAETDSSAADSVARRIQKQKQAVAAALEFMSKQKVSGLVLSSSNVENFPGGSDTLNANGLPANKFRIAAYPANPNTNYSRVDFGSVDGTAVKVEAIFMEVPTFVQHVGISKVPVFANAASGSPRLEIVLALDLSGSMDDSTRITLVNKVAKLNAAGEAAINNLPPKPPPPNLPSEDDLGDTIRNQCGEPSTSEDPNDPGYNPGYEGCRQGVIDDACRDYNQAKETYNNALNALNIPGYLYWHYNVVAAGQLRRILEAGGATISDAGTQINALPHRHFQYLAKTFTGPSFQYPFLGYGSKDDKCSPGGGFCALVVNLDDHVSLRPDQYPQPTFNSNETANPPYFTDVFGRAGPNQQGNSYVNLADLTEAALGATSASDAWSPYEANTQVQWPGVTFGGETRRAEYELDARNYLQPAATVIDAANAFIDALADSGRNVKLSLAGYDTDVVDNVDLPDDPNTSDDQVLNKKSKEVNEEGVIREIPMVGLVPLSNPAAVLALKNELKKMFSLRTTNMDKALLEARDILKASTTRGVKKAIVLFSDGQFSEDSQPPFGTAALCKTDKIAINTIGLAQNLQLQPKMQQTLSQITNDAGNGGIFLSAPSAAEVKKAFLLLARRMVKLQQ